MQDLVAYKLCDCIFVSELEQLVDDLDNDYIDMSKGGILSDVFPPLLDDSDVSFLILPFIIRNICIACTWYLMLHVS